MRVVIVGAAGRMGCAILDELDQSCGISLAGAIDRDADASRGITTDLEAALRNADVMIDFSSPTSTAANLAACAHHDVAALVGTTGLGDDAERAASAASARVPVLIAANTSLGVTLLTELVRTAAFSLPADFDIEITEGHHRYKKDAPSGTALALGRAAAEGRGRDLESVRGVPREGGAQRKSGEIGFSVIRAGDLVGEHIVMFVGTGERLTLGHQATDRIIFARGALKAASWLVGRVPGRYRMVDVLGLKTKG
ncbi:MAG: 4-hydroxy-tetrahydrodipicolinate reductase [Gammaproteobacteria bacterium]|nr:4-hydroxy-tetrahydrodipicolinate reductase [Gammaproteobacteria bacterium]